MSNETNITEAKGNLFQVKRFVDDLTLIDSATIHCTIGSLITIMLDDFSLKFHLIKDPNEKRRLRLKSQSNHEIILEFVNFNENLGAGVLKPSSLFTINGVNVYFTFFIKSLDEDQREFSYSLLAKI